MVLRGQNFRVLLKNGTKYRCIAMATNCTVNLTNNTESSSTKDDVGLADKPTLTTHSWSVQVESLDVSDTASLLSAIKSFTPVQLMWAQTDATDNQTVVTTDFNRMATAYINDAVFQFDNNVNSTKQIQFVGSEAISAITESPTYEAVSTLAYTKGQFVRLWLSYDNIEAPSVVVAGARTLSLHVSVTFESVQTKDTEGYYEVQGPTGLSYDITTSALIASNERITSNVGGKSFNSFLLSYQNGALMKWLIGNVSGDNQRTLGSTIVSGSCLLTSLQANAQNRGQATYQATLTGYGDYTVVVS